jgi:protoheme IX farnesyltransferase
MANFLEIIKPGITLWIGITAFGGAVIADNELNFYKILIICIFIMFSSAGSSVLNNYFDSDIDSKMERTKHRALADHRINRKIAFVYGLVLCIIGLVGILYFSFKAFILDMIAIFSYSVIYTFLKRKTPFAFIVGLIPGAIPSAIGYTAIKNDFNITAFMLFSLMALWQVPHTLYLLIMLRKDYENAKIPVLSVVYGYHYTKYLSFIYALSIIPVSLVIFLMCHLSYFYLVFIILISLFWIIMNFLYFKCFISEKFMFLSSNFYIMLVFLLMAFDRIIVNENPQKINDKYLNPNIKIEVFAQNLEIPLGK